MLNSFQRPAVLDVRRASGDTITAGDSAVVEWSPSLLDALMTGTPPPAAGTHPMSGLPLGIMTEAALLACGRDQTGVTILVYANVSFRAPVPRDRPWLGRATVQSIGRRHVRVAASLHDGDVELCRGVLGVARVVAGRAAASLASGAALEHRSDED